MITISKDDIKEAVAENNAMESDSEESPEMELSAPGFQSTIELKDAKSFEHAVQLLDTLKQKEHSEPLDRGTDTEAETETGVSEEQIKSIVKESVDDIRESVQKLSDRTAGLEGQVESIPEDEESVDPSRIDELEDTLQQLAERTDSLQNSVSELQEQPEPEPEEPEEETGEEKATVEESGDEDTGESEKEGVECPQCGRDFDSTSALSTHTSQSSDHTNVGEFFRNGDGERKCPVCGEEISDSGEFSLHFQEEHSTTMVQYYLNHFEELEESEDADQEEEESSQDHEQSDGETEAPEDPDEGKYSCGDCGKTFDSPVEARSDRHDCEEDTGPEENEGAVGEDQQMVYHSSRETIIGFEPGDKFSDIIYECACGNEYQNYEEAKEHEVDSSHNDWVIYTPEKKEVKATA